MKDQRLQTRLFSQMGVSLCEAAIDIAGQRLTPDASKAYAEFSIAHSWPAVTAYGTTMHPGTVANSWGSMLHQVFNKAHLMKSYAKDDIARDHILGSIVAVESTARPGHGTYRMGESASIRAAAVIHKQAEGVPKILGEHLGGRHKWTVSMEVDYSILGSGFLLPRAGATAAQERLMAETSPEEFTAQGLGYLGMEQAPEELLETYAFEKLMMKPHATWGKLPVTLVKGGVNGQVHFRGVGLVQYGAEKEAQIAQILATDPDRLTLDEDGAAVLEPLRGYFQSICEGLSSLG